MSSHTYAEVMSLVATENGPEPDLEHWTDRSTNLPMLGFLVASLIALPLWALIAWMAWALVA